MKCIHGRLYGTYGKIENAGVIQQLIPEEVMRHRTSGIAKKVKALYETYKLRCEDNMRKPMSANRLSSELSQNERLYNIEATNNIYAGEKRVRGFVGIEVLAKHPF